MLNHVYAIKHSCGEYLTRARYKGILSIESDEVPAIFENVEDAKTTLKTFIRKEKGCGTCWHPECNEYRWRDGERVLCAKHGTLRKEDFSIALISIIAVTFDVEDLGDDND